MTDGASPDIGIQSKPPAETRTGISRFIPKFFVRNRSAVPETPSSLKELAERPIVEQDPVAPSSLTPEQPKIVDLHALKNAKPETLSPEDRQKQIYIKNASTPKPLKDVVKGYVPPADRKGYVSGSSKRQEEPQTSQSEAGKPTPINTAPESKQEVAAD